MTMPPGAEQMADPGNTLLAQVPVTMACGTIDLPDGQLAVLTFRTASTTFTAMPSAEKLKTWIDLLAGVHSTMSSSGLVIARGALPPMSAPPSGRIQQR